MREQGVIKKYWPDHGYGFIGRDGCSDLFFHVSELPDGIDTIEPGARIEFSITEDRRGRLKAVRIELL